MDIHEAIDVLEPLWQIGRETQANGRFELMLAEEIVATGKATTDLTVFEIHELLQRANERFNQVREYV